MWRELLGLPLRTASDAPQNPTSMATEPPLNADQHVTARAGDLEARVSQLTAQVQGLQLEWSETLDKLSRWASRQSARDRRRVAIDLDGLAGDAQEAHEDAPGATNGGGPTSGSLPDRTALKAALRRRIHSGG